MTRKHRQEGEDAEHHQLQTWLDGDVTLTFARLKRPEREIFERTGLVAAIGEERFFPTVRAGAAAFERARTSG